jgi:hypothetical protein
MSQHARRLIALAATLAVVGAMSVAAAPAFAGITLTLTNHAVSGYLTPKKLGEPVVLPKHSTFNGVANLASSPPTPGWGGTLTGSLYVPPFEASLKLGGVVPTNVGVTFKEVGTSEGTIGEAPAADCPDPAIPGPCAQMKVTSKAIIGMTELGLLGIGTPVHCETSEPVVFNLTDYLTFEEITEIGPHFTGTVTIPSVTCSGVEGVLVGPLLTTLMSGPENPYSLYIGLREPEPPSFQAEPAAAISQVSALLKAGVDPNGEALSSCEFEYGPTTSYGTTVPCSPEASAIKRPFVDNYVHGQAAGLSEGATYHYRVVATNAQGTTDGPDQEVTTLAAAGAPEYGQCVAQKGGNYSDDGCSVVAEKKGVPDHKGGFEWVPGPASSACVAQKKGEYTESSCATKSAKPKKGTFEKLGGPGFTSTTEAVKLETPGLGSTVVCSAGSGKGEVTGLSTGVEHITLSGCEAAGKKCTSEGSNSTPSGTAGVIDTNLLDTRLLSTATEVWTQLTSAEHQPYVAEFGCEGVLLRVSGALAGVQEHDIGIPSLTSTTTFGDENAGEQALTTASSTNGGSSWSAADPTSVVVLATNTAASPTEIHP